VSIEKLPSNWSAASPPAQLQVLGDEWLERSETAVLKVPSAVVTEEWNYLLNPLKRTF
jgi:RES domain-containing protein